MAEVMILRKKQPQAPKGEIRVKLYDNRKVHKAELDAGIRGKHVGVAIAYKRYDTGAIHVGWSVCNPKDRYDKALALKIASGRAGYSGVVGGKPPRFVQDQLDAFGIRAEKYFNNPNPAPKRKKQKA